jgi:hypothetical protein
MESPAQSHYGRLIDIAASATPAAPATSRLLARHRRNLMTGWPAVENLIRPSWAA